MAANPTKYWTKSLTSALVITADDNVSNVTLKVASGTCTVLGTRQFKGIDSEPVQLSAGDTLTLPSHGQNDPIIVTITPTGTTDVVITF